MKDLYFLNKDYIKSIHISGTTGGSKDIGVPLDPNKHLIIGIKCSKTALMPIIWNNHHYILVFNGNDASNVQVEADVYYIEK